MDIDRPVACHAHPQCHALFKIGGDDSRFEVDGHNYPLADGAAVLVNAWQPHAYPFQAARCGRSRVLALYIEPAWLARIEASFGAAARRDFFAAPCISVPSGVDRAARALAEELGGERADPSRACALLQVLMTELALRFSRYRDIPAWARAADCTIGDHRIRKAMRLIAESAAESIDAADVARAVAMSRPHFFHAFRRDLGVTPNVFRNVVRMERAYRALLETETPVGAMGAQLGFSAHPHFTRFFRANHGVSPEAYRQAVWRVNA
jgi:AraC-like DNA-binding protein